MDAFASILGFCRKQLRRFSRPDLHSATKLQVNRAHVHTDSREVSQMPRDQFCRAWGTRVAREYGISISVSQYRSLANGYLGARGERLSLAFPRVRGRSRSPIEGMLRELALLRILPSPVPKHKKANTGAEVSWRRGFQPRVSLLLGFPNFDPAGGARGVAELLLT